MTDAGSRKATQIEGGRRIIAGSNTAPLSREMGSKLTRHVTVDVFPFSFREYLRHLGVTGAGRADDEDVENPLEPPPGTKRQIWSYCGLGIVTRSSSDWIRDKNGQWQRAQVQQTRGLNLTHNHHLKAIFKGAATTVIAQHPDEPLNLTCQHWLAAGTKPNLARVSLRNR